MPSDSPWTQLDPLHRVRRLGLVLLLLLLLVLRGVARLRAKAGPLGGVVGGDEALGAALARASGRCGGPSSRRRRGRGRRAARPAPLLGLARRARGTGGRSRRTSTARPVGLGLDPADADLGEVAHDVLAVGRAVHPDVRHRFDRGLARRRRSRPGLEVVVLLAALSRGRRGSTCRSPRGSSSCARPCRRRGPSRRPSGGVRPPGGGQACARPLPSWVVRRDQVRGRWVVGRPGGGGVARAITTAARRVVMGRTRRGVYDRGRGLATGDTMRTAGRAPPRRRGSR